MLTFIFFLLRLGWCVVVVVVVMMIWVVLVDNTCKLVLFLNIVLLVAILFLSMLNKNISIILIMIINNQMPEV